MGRQNLNLLLTTLAMLCMLVAHAATAQAEPIRLTFDGSMRGDGTTWIPRGSTAVNLDVGRVSSSLGFFVEGEQAPGMNLRASMKMLPFEAWTFAVSADATVQPAAGAADSYAFSASLSIRLSEG